jgi:hypothetical protein
MLQTVERAVHPGLFVPVRARVSVERLLWWAYAPGRGGIWYVDKGLSLDGGLTARPRRRERGSWALVEACYGMRLVSGARVSVLGTRDRDVDMVVAAVERLPRGSGALVERHARGRSRPDWLEVERWWEPVRDETGRGKVTYLVERGHRKVQWCGFREVVERRLTERGMARWRLWREGLARLELAVGNGMERWYTDGSLPEVEPWR